MFVIAQHIKSQAELKGGGRDGGKRVDSNLEVRGMLAICVKSNYEKEIRKRYLKGGHLVTRDSNTTLMKLP